MFTWFKLESENSKTILKLIICKKKKKWCRGHLRKCPVIEEGSCEISSDVCVSVCFLRRGHRPCGRHAVGCWTRWWARARCGLSSRGSEQGRGPSASPPVLGTPPTPPPAQGAPDSCARPADWPSPSSDARWARAVAGHDECGAKNWPPAHLHGWTRDKRRGWSEYWRKK